MCVVWLRAHPSFLNVLAAPFLSLYATILLTPASCLLWSPWYPAIPSSPYVACFTVTLLACYVSCLLTSHAILLCRERRESRAIEKVVERLNPELEPALLQFMPKINVEMIRLLLDEKKSVKERRERLVDLVLEQAAEPLTAALNERVDVAFLPERAESVVLRKVVERMLKEVVEWTVNEVDESVTKELEETRRRQRRGSDSD